MVGGLADELRQNKPGQVYIGKTRGDDSQTWMVKCYINEKDQIIEYEREMQESLLLIGEIVDSFCEFAPNRFLLQLRESTELLIVHDWQVVKQTPVAGYYTIDKALLLPGFNEETFPFVVSYDCGLDYSGKALKGKAFNLINVKTGFHEELIKGTAQNNYRQSAAFITDNRNGEFDIDFCTSVQTKDVHESSWHNMKFDSQFTRILREYGRLPIDDMD